MTNTTTQTAAQVETAAAIIGAQASAKASANTAKRHGAKVSSKIKDAGSAAFANIGRQVKSTMVTTGGTNAEPEKADAASFPRVTMAELSVTGNTLSHLAFNFLAGNIDPSITVETLNSLPRALRNEKTAIKGLLGKKSADIRACWEKEQAQRKRLDSPTLRALWTACKDKKPRGTTETWQQKVTKILDGKQSPAMKIQMLRELVGDKG